MTPLPLNTAPCLAGSTEQVVQTVRVGESLVQVMSARERQKLLLQHFGITARQYAQWKGYPQEVRDFTVWSWAIPLGILIYVVLAIVIKPRGDALTWFGIGFFPGLFALSLLAHAAANVILRIKCSLQRDHLFEGGAAEAIGRYEDAWAVYQAKQEARQSRETERYLGASSPICPRPNCGAMMVHLRGRFGDFHRCRNYPKCTETRPGSAQLD